MVVWCTPRPVTLNPHVLIKRLEPTMSKLIYLDGHAYRFMGRPCTVCVGRSEDQELLLKSSFRGGFYVDTVRQSVSLPQGGRFEGYAVWETETASGLNEFLTQADFPEGLYNLQYEPLYGCYVAKLETRLGD